MALVAIVVVLLYIAFILIGWGARWRKYEKKRMTAALGRAHGDARQTADDEAILHGDLGAILGRQMPGAADTDPP